MNHSDAKPTNVLIADDDDDDYLIFSVAVSEIEVAVILSRAADGERLMDMLQDELPDILFLDLLLPIKDGKQCLKELRSDRRYDTMPIIVYTSMEDLDSIEYCYREGSNLYTIKPSSIEELKIALQRILTIDWKKTLYFPPKSEFVIARRRA